MTKITSIFWGLDKGLYSILLEIKPQNPDKSNEFRKNKHFSLKD